MKTTESLAIEFYSSDTNNARFIETKLPITLEEVKCEIAKNIGCDKKRIQISGEYHKKGLIDTEGKFQQLLWFRVPYNNRYWLTLNIHLLSEHNEVEQLKKEKRILLDKLNSVKSELESDKRVLLDKLTNTYSELSNLKSKNRRQETVVKMILNLAKEHDSELFQQLQEYLG